MGALDGVQVLDFGQYIAGPLAAMLLADQGAEVIRIDPPGGPRFDTPANATWNRGKRSIVLDLAAPSDRETARALASKADVLIENFRPGVMARLGLDLEALGALNRRLVTLSMPGFASDDPRSDLRAWEGVVGAAAGTYTTQLGGADRQPVYTAIPIASGYAALVGATSVGMALAARERDGLGQHIEVPLFDAMFQAIGGRGLKVHSAGPQVLRGLPWVRQYECADGRWVMFHAAYTHFIEQFVRAAGVESWREDGLLDRMRVAADPELGKELLARMTALFKTRPALEWEELVNAAGTPCSICRPSAEWLEHPHAHEAEMIVEVDDSQYGKMRQPGVQVRLSETPGAVRGAAPALDADRGQILAEAAETPAAVSDSTEAGALMRSALAGVKVLDLCIILAGPTCGRTLAEFGADVIKIDFPGREGGVAFHHDINRGKRSILIDLNTAEGKDLFWRMVDDADVIVQNYRLGKMKKLGIDYESVRARRPDIVYASLNAYGDIGPWATRPGWEQLAQACTGMQERYGGDNHQPVLQPYAINDYGTGFMGAFGVAMALRHRARTGEGQHVQTALARTACTLQSLFMQDYEGKTWEEPRGQEAVGDGPLHRLYRANDGWLFLAGRESDRPNFAQVPGLEAAAELSGDALERYLTEQIAGECVECWTERLNAAGFGAHRTMSVDTLMNDPWVQAHGLSLTREHDGAGLITTNGPSPRLSRTPVVPGRPAPLPGADALDILAEFGHEGDIDRLVSAGAVVIEGISTR